MLLCGMEIPSVGGREVARMILVADVSKEETLARKTVFAGTITAFVVGGTLLVFFYWLVGRIGQRIESNEKKLRELATHDGLTGLYNHRSFYNILENEIACSQRYHRSTSLLLLDIDYFKQVNAKEISQLVSHTDIALYEAKKGGRNITKVFQLTKDAIP